MTAFAILTKLYPIFAYREGKAIPGHGLIVSYLCNAHHGGGEEHAHQISKHLVGLGEELTYVTTLCPHSHAPFLCPDLSELERFEASCGYPIVRIGNRFLGYGRWFTPSAVLNQFRLLRDLYAVVRRMQPQFIIVNQGVFLCAACWIISKLARVPVVQIVHHLHATMGQGVRGRVRRTLARFAFRAVDVNVCVSKATERDVAEFADTDRVKTAVISNAVDLDAVDAWRSDDGVGSEAMRLLRERGYTEKPGPVILTVARLEENKGIQWGIRAMPKIMAEFPEARYVVVGDGTYRSQLKSIADSVLPDRQQGSVVFLGRVSDAEKYTLYEACDLFVMPSSEEGFGLVYAEAGAFGKPSIGCDVMGVPEAIAHGETGLLVPPNDADAVAEAVLRLLRNDEERARMGAAARKRVESMGTWEDRAKQYQQLIGELMAKRRRRK